MSEMEIREWSSLQMMLFNARTRISTKEWPVVDLEKYSVKKKHSDTLAKLCLQLISRPEKSY